MRRKASLEQEEEREDKASLLSSEHFQAMDQTERNKRSRQAAGFEEDQLVEMTGADDLLPTGAGAVENY